MHIRLFTIIDYLDLKTDVLPWTPRTIIPLCLVALVSDKSQYTIHPRPLFASKKSNFLSRPF